MKKIIKLKIDSMHCKSCSDPIEKRLTTLKGISHVETDLIEKKVKITFDSEKIGEDEINFALNELGYSIDGKSVKKAGNQTINQALIYSLVPHIGCIGFIIASILGATIAVELFKPLLMNPWFFHILILVSILFATVSSFFYLKNNGMLSIRGVKAKRNYLATMYGITIGVNLLLFLFIFPMLANLDTGSFANANTAPTAVVSGQTGVLEIQPDSIITLVVDIPCPGHASLITGELKKIVGVTGVKFVFPNNFEVAYTSSKTTLETILSPDVFEIYPAKIISEELILN